MNFTDFQLPETLSSALLENSFTVPTKVQREVIPLALCGKDMLVRAATGSGKTLAYLIPILSKILARSSQAQDLFAIIIVPTKELSRQVTSVLDHLGKLCGVYTVNLGTDQSHAVQAQLLEKHPQIIVSTPLKFLTHTLSTDNVHSIVIDEADVLISCDSKTDIEKIIDKLPNVVQTILISATLSTELDELTMSILKEPAVVNVLESEEEAKKLQQFAIKCVEQDKYLMLYVCLKLKLILGKILIFTNDTDRSYRLKLFMEKFGIKSCVVNSEMPILSRCHVIEEFNKGAYDIVIATDSENIEAGESNSGESGLSRGIDFQNVAVVLNFDMPLSAKAYSHRIGRTARAHQKGMSLSFVSESENAIFSNIQEEQEREGKEIKPYSFDLKQVEGFRYRMQDALRSCTKALVKEARLKEIRDEIINSEKLKQHFSENPADLEALRHDKIIHPNRIQPHLKKVPEYMMVNGKKRKLVLPETMKFSNPLQSSWKRKKKKRSNPLNKFSKKGKK